MHGGRRPGTDGKVDRVEVILQVLESQVRAQRLPTDDADAHRLDDADLGVQGRLGKPVLGDAVAHHPARLRLALEDRHVVARQRGVEGGAQPGRSRTDDRESLACRLAHGGDPRLLAAEVPVGGEPLDAVDGDWLVEEATSALGLTGMRANPAADGREGVAVLHHPHGGLEVPVGDQCQIALDVDLRRAALLARRLAVGVVVTQQLFDPELPVGVEWRRAGVHLQAGGDGGDAGLHVTPLGADLDDAESAVAVGPFEPEVVAQRGYVDPLLLQGCEDRETIPDAQWTAVHRDGHVGLNGRLDHGRPLGSGRPPRPVGR